MRVSSFWGPGDGLLPGLPQPEAPTNQTHLSPTEDLGMPLKEQKCPLEASQMVCSQAHPNYDGSWTQPQDQGHPGAEVSFAVPSEQSVAAAQTWASLASPQKAPSASRRQARVSSCLEGLGD